MRWVILKKVATWVTLTSGHVLSLPLILLRCKREMWAERTQHIIYI